MNQRALKFLSLSSLSMFVVVAGLLVYRSGQQADADNVGATPAPGPWSEDGLKDFTLTNQDGEPVTKKDLLGQPWVVTFIFTPCGGPCPKVTKAIKTLHDRFKGKPVRFVTITVLPEMDTPEVLKQYSKVFSADLDRWYFLTGEKDKIYRMIQTQFLMPVKEITGPDRKPGWEVMHTTNALLVDADGVVRSKFNTLKADELVKLRRAIQTELDKK